MTGVKVEKLWISAFVNNRLNWWSRGVRRSTGRPAVIRRPVGPPAPGGRSRTRSLTRPGRQVRSGALAVTGRPPRASPAGGADTRGWRSRAGTRGCGRSADPDPQPCPRTPAPGVRRPRFRPARRSPPRVALRAGGHARAGHRGAARAGRVGPGDASRRARRSAPDHREAAPRRRRSIAFPRQAPLGPAPRPSLGDRPTEAHIEVGERLLGEKASRVSRTLDSATAIPAAVPAPAPITSTTITARRPIARMSRSALRPSSITAARPRPVPAARG